MELMLRVDDPAFAGEIRSRIAEDIAVSDRIDRARHRPMSNGWRKLKWTIAILIVATQVFNAERRRNQGNAGAGQAGGRNGGGRGMVGQQRAERGWAGVVNN